MDILNALIQLDHRLFLFFNSSCGNPVFDVILPLCREKLFWAPLYLFVLLVVWRNYARKSALLWIFGLLLTITIADTWSSRVLKPNVQCLRPCRTEVLLPLMHARVPCGSGYSFTSSHATNHFAAAAFLSMLLGASLPIMRKTLYIWAAVIAFSQVYVGVHFPLDVLCGALFGVVIGLGVYRFCAFLQHRLIT